MSNSMENAESEAKKQIAANLIPAGLSAQFDVIFDPVFEANNWRVKATVKNNSNVAVRSLFVKVPIYAFDDKKRLLYVYPTTIYSPETEVLNPGEEAQFFTMFGDYDHRIKSFGAGLEITPYAIPAK
jgi:hypothetical protein